MVHSRRSNRSRLSFAFALLSAATVLAAPRPYFSKLTTHRKRAVASGAVIESYQPEATFETFGAGIPLDIPVNSFAGDAVADAANLFLHSRLNVESGSFQPASTSVTDTVTHVHLNQVINGLPVLNSVANVAITSDSKVASYGVNFVKPVSTAPNEPKLSTEDAFVAAEQALSATRVDSPASTQYFLNEAGDAVLVHVVQVRTADNEHWYQASIDATTGKVVDLTDFVAQAAYRVVPITKQDPTQGFELLTDPEDTTASPNGWHDAGSKLTTSGNNAISFKGSQSATQAQSGPNAFDFAFDASADPTAATNLALAKTNAFYIVNKVHDITYRYGFTEKTFNFQDDNAGKGGKDGDRVVISVQDGGGTNNANFATPPDGQSGEMNMFIWTQTNPKRDGSLENDIIVHEMTHGITNRMTGGGTGRCLSSTEAGGMGEGWSDAMAFWTQQTSSTVKDFTMGSFVNKKGIRSHAYSTSKSVNPLTYASVATLNEVHNIGEVWANTLINVYAALVKELGFSKTAETDPTGSQGNVVFLHLFLDALLLQPCNPTMPTARAAWIQADANRYKGAHTCTLWKAFASRGLGQKAANHVDDATIPSNC